MATVTVYFDDRKTSKSGTYPVVLKIYNDKVTKFYPVFHNYQRLKLKPSDFSSSYEAVKPKGEHREYKTSIEANIKRAQDIIDRLDPFTFPAFEIGYLGNTKVKSDLLALFETIIFENEEQGRIKNADAYQTALRSFIDYFERKQRLALGEIQYKAITPQMLQDYERYITEVEIKKDGKILKKKGSISTVGAYTRALRSVFNRAIAEGYVNTSLYPFGKGKNKYQIPAGRKVKKGLSKEQIKELVEVDLSDNEKATKARDFWLLSFVCNGIQYKDLANLRYKDIHGDFFHFVRHKTKNTTKANLTPISVPITEHVRYMIKRYGNPEDRENYIFPILKEGMNPREMTRAVSNFTRFVSQNLETVAQKLGLTVSLANMVARHSFATALIRAGKPLELAQGAMGHTSKRTTENYFAGFEDSELMEVNTQLLKFS